MQVREEQHRLLIGGEPAEPASGQYFETYDPATGEVLAHLPRGGAQDVDRAVAAAAAAFDGKEWRDMPAAQRGRLLGRMAGIIRERRDEIASIEAVDTGKPLSQAKTDVETAARYFEYYGGMADKVGGEVIPTRPGVFDFTVREPYGVTAHIVPWNFPFMLTARSVAPALAAGNTVVVKPAEEASLSLLRMGALALEAGFPAGIFNVVTGYGHEAGAALSSHPGVQHITFTGSVEVGTLVMKAAAENIVPVTLELGGKSPNIVFADADLAQALPTVVRTIILNAGQVCNAGSRLLVQSSVHDQLVEAVQERFQQLRLGAPLDDPDLGPSVSDKQKERVLAYIEIANEEGARVASAGELPKDPELQRGYYVLPTVLDEVKPGHRVFSEEIFGPVLAVSTFDDLEEALEQANGTPYGLVTGIWTRDVTRAFYLASRIKAGQVAINGFTAGGPVEVPFGGYKKSGFGREKGIEGLHHYTQVKSISAHFA